MAPPASPSQRHRPTAIPPVIDLTADEDIISPRQQRVKSRHIEFNQRPEFPTTASALGRYSTLVDLTSPSPEPPIVSGLLEARTTDLPSEQSAEKHQSPSDITSRPQLPLRQDLHTHLELLNKPDPLTTGRRSSNAELALADTSNLRGQTITAHFGRSDSEPQSQLLQDHHDKETTSISKSPTDVSAQTPSRRTKCPESVSITDLLRKVETETRLQSEMQESHDAEMHYNADTRSPASGISKDQTMSSGSILHDYVVSKAPTLDYEAIKKVWSQVAESMLEEHAYFSRNKFAQARYQEQKAAETTQKRILEGLKTSRDRQSNPDWFITLPNIAKTVHRNARHNEPDAFYIAASTSKGNSERTFQAVPMQKIMPDSENVPHFKAYHPIRHSQLVPSETELFYWPEVIDAGMDLTKVLEELKGQFQFRMGMERRGLEVQYIQCAIALQPYAKQFLEKLGLSETLMLRFLLDDTYDKEVVEPIYKKMGCRDAMATLRKTRRHARMAPQWKLIRKRISTIGADQLESDEDIEKKFACLSFAHYVIIDHVHQLLGIQTDAGQALFSFIFILAESDSLDLRSILSIHQSDSRSGKKYSLADHWEFACPVCYQYPCFVHGLESTWDHRFYAKGDYRRYHDVSGSGDSESADDDDNDRDGIKNTGARTRPMFDFLDKLYREDVGRRPMQRATGKRQRDVEFDRRDLYMNPNTDPDDTHRVFFPCDHEGSCRMGICRCVRGKVGSRLCDKTCGCPSYCPLRFKGCTCAQNGKPCSRENKCPCRANSRECDPDLCGMCGVIDVLDPRYRNRDGSFLDSRCQNCAIQLNLPARTLLGASTVHGFGLFAGRDIRAGEYVGEYLGSKLTWKQAERAGQFLGLMDYSYLMDVVNDQTIDSNTIGTKIRFINNAKKGDKATPLGPNCCLKKLRCNTEMRMGVFASRNIAINEELFFDYGEEFFKASSTEDMGMTQETLSEASDIDRSSLCESDDSSSLGLRPKSEIIAVKQRIEGRAEPATILTEQMKDSSMERIESSRQVKIRGRGRDAGSSDDGMETYDIDQYLSVERERRRVQQRKEESQEEYTQTNDNGDGVTTSHDSEDSDGDEVMPSSRRTRSSKPSTTASPAPSAVKQSLVVALRIPSGRGKGSTQGSDETSQAPPAPQQQQSHQQPYQQQQPQQQNQQNQSSPTVHIRKAARKGALLLRPRQP